MNYVPSKYSQLRSRLKSKYQIELRRTLKEIKKLPARNIYFWVLEHADELKSYSSLNWHLLNQIKAFNFFNSQTPELGKKHFGELEEVVFEKWNNSEFADYFLKSLNQGNYLGKASLKHIK